MKVKEHPNLDDSPLLNEKDHKDFQNMIGVCQWLIVEGIFDLAYFVSSLSRFSSAPQVGHIDLSRKIFCYFNKYPKKGYVIDPQPLPFDANHEKVQMKYDFGNKYE